MYTVMSLRFRFFTHNRLRSWVLRNVLAWILIIIVVVDSLLAQSSAKVLSIPHVRHFEPVDYDHHVLFRQHHLAKRSVGAQVEFDFRAFNIHFKARLQRDTSALHPNFTIETAHDNVAYDTERVYFGIVQGLPSRINGIISSSGHFEGRILTDNETYFLERSKHHFQEAHSFHSVLYKLSDVNFSPFDTICGVQRLYESLGHVTRDVFRREGKNTELDFQEESKRYTNKYLQEVNEYGSNGSHRHKRAIDPGKTTCELYMQADHLYYQRYYSDVETVIEKLTQHVQAINNIFTVVDFDGNGSPDNINFIIKKIKIHDDPTVTGYKYDGNLGVETLLDLHSTDNYDDYCLSYLFTYRDFDGGVLGLAWVGDTSNAGGVCETYKEFQGVHKSLNTGIVSVINYNKDVPSAVSHVTFAHEVGHNFGSQHDPDDSSECSPGGDDGNYIMYAYATSGTQANNDKFSTCSVGYIGPVLEVKARGDDGCFVANTNAICGNRIKEDGEECDCGWDSECTEGCCNPQTDTPGAETPCTRKSTAVCSPSEGACCSDLCQYRLSADNHSCRNATSCQEEAFCDGANYNATCPASVSKADATACGDSQDFLVCYDGECSGSICLAHGRLPCYCSPTTPGDDKDAKLCHVCCKDDEGNCKSSYELDDIPDAKVIAGTPCNNYAGYCDVYKKCRSVNPSGPLSNLNRLFLDGELINTMKEFLTKHWYIGVAAGLLFVIIIGLVIKFCRKTYKPVDLPESTPRATERNRVRPV